jgi:hypothetical protein
MRTIGKTAALITLIVILSPIMGASVWAFRLACCPWRIEHQPGQPTGNGVTAFVIVSEGATITNVKPPLNWRAELCPTRSGNALHLFPPAPIREQEVARWALSFDSNELEPTKFLMYTIELGTQRQLELQNAIKQE